MQVIAYPNDPDVITLQGGTFTTREEAETYLDRLMCLIDAVWPNYVDTDPEPGAKEPVPKSDPASVVEFKSKRASRSEHGPNAVGD